MDLEDRLIMEEEEENFHLSRLINLLNQFHKINFLNQFIQSIPQDQFFNQFIQSIYKKIF